VSRRALAAAAIVLLTAVGCKHSSHASDPPSPQRRSAIPAPADPSASLEPSDANGDSGVLP
jgi:hypothetical protein